MKRFFVVDSDCLGIVQRLKEIDKDYFLVYDISGSVYKLYSKSGLSFDHCLTFPFGCIDERMVDLALKTRVQNSDSLFEEIERENEKNNKQILSATINAFKERLYES